MGKVLDIQNNLVIAIKNNNESVLKELYQKNYPKVESLILKNNGTKEQAKDFYQEAFIALWKNVKQEKFIPKNETALQGYLYQIAKNKWTDYLRSSQFKKTTSLEGEIMPEENQDDAIKNLLTKETELIQLEKGLKKLGEECKTLLKLFYYKKNNLKEIAQIFNIGEASARNKKYRCILHLKQLILEQKNDQ